MFGQKKEGKKMNSTKPPRGFCSHFFILVFDIVTKKNFYCCIEH